jgi:hypothetical protein
VYHVQTFSGEDRISESYAPTRKIAYLAAVNSVSRCPGLWAGIRQADERIGEAESDADGVVSVSIRLPRSGQWREVYPLPLMRRAGVSRESITRTWGAYRHAIDSLGPDW